MMNSPRDPHRTTAGIPHDAVAAMIPAPRKWVPQGGHLSLTKLTAVRTRSRDMFLADQAQLLVERLIDVSGRRLVVRNDDDATTGSDGALVLRRRAGISDEAYRLEITAGGLNLSATDDRGVARGVAAIEQLLVLAGGRKLPLGVLNDGPAFRWRGLLLDSARHFIPVDTIKGVVDRLALARFNVLHWHLTDDQGWRLEIPALPRLTGVGAWRQAPDGGSYGGFYTADQVREIVAHAGRRGLTVVPEIEMPGHSQAALAAYPELSCTGGPFDVQTQWGIHPDILCAGRETTFAFLETVLDHVLELFPSPYVHIGGDEAPRDRWRHCPHCQARLQSENLPDEAALQAWFIRRIEAYLAQRGRRIIGWDEILDGDDIDASRATVQAWRNTDGAVAAARAGRNAIVSPTSHAYFDYDVGQLDLQRVYAFDPVPDRLDESETAHILGGAANLWTERIPPEQIDHKLYPRLLAMAEALWSAPTERDFPVFLARLRAHTPILQHLGVTPGPSARPVRLVSGFDRDLKCTVLEGRIEDGLRGVLAESDLALRYRRLDADAAFYPDRAPDEQILPQLSMEDGAARPTVDLAAAGGRQVWLGQLFIDGYPYGATAAAELVGHVALGLAVEASPEPDRNGADGLTDGRHGSRDFNDGCWTGWNGTDIDAVIDLGRPRELTCVSVRALQDAHARAFLPNRIEVAVDDGKSGWRTVATITHAISDLRQAPLTHEFSAPLSTTTARRLRVRAVNFGSCPGWHPSSGRPTWIFLDQIVANSPR